MSQFTKVLYGYKSLSDKNYNGLSDTVRRIIEKDIFSYPITCLTPFSELQVTPKVEMASQEVNVYFLIQLIRFDKQIAISFAEEHNLFAELKKLASLELEFLLNYQEKQEKSQGIEIGSIVATRRSYVHSIV